MHNSGLALMGFGVAAFWVSANMVDWHDFLLSMVASLPYALLSRIVEQHVQEHIYTRPRTSRTINLS